MCTDVKRTSFKSLHVLQMVNFRYLRSLRSGAYRFHSWKKNGLLIGVTSPTWLWYHSHTHFLFGAYNWYSCLFGILSFSRRSWLKNAIAHSVLMEILILLRSLRLSPYRNILDTPNAFVRNATQQGCPPTDSTSSHSRIISILWRGTSMLRSFHTLTRRSQIVSAEMLRWHSLRLQQKVGWT